MLQGRNPSSTDLQGAHDAAGAVDLQADVQEGVAAAALEPALRALDLRRAVD